MNNYQFAAPLPTSSMIETSEPIRNVFDKYGLSTTLQVIEVARCMSKVMEISLQISVDLEKYKEIDRPELTIRHSYILPRRGNTEQPLNNKPNLDVCIKISNGNDEKELVSVELYDLSDDVGHKLILYPN